MNNPPAVIRVTVSPDGLTAHLYLEPSLQGQEPTLQEVLHCLEAAHITYGLDRPKVEQMVMGGVFRRKELIAQGKPPAAGKDGRLEYYVEERTSLKPKELAGGRVDHRDLGYFTNVEKGQKIARRMPPLPPQAGTSVTGKRIEPPPVKDVLLPRGINTAPAVDDPDLLVATSSGALHFGRTSIDVLQEKTIASDIDYSTGNLEFAGTLRIMGSVRSGFKVKAHGNIEIGRDVEDAEIDSNGNVVIRGGFSGMGKGHIKAGKDVRVKFINNQHITAEGSVYIESEAINAVIHAGKDVQVEGDGLLSGGKITVANRLKAKTIGSPNEIRTEIYLGLSPALLQENDYIAKRSQWIMDKIEQIKAVIFEKVKAHIDAPQTEEALFQGEVEKLKQEQRQLKSELEKIKKRQEEIEAKYSQCKEARVEAGYQIFGGVILRHGALEKIFKEKSPGGTILPQGDKLAYLK